MKKLSILGVVIVLIIIYSVIVSIILHQCSFFIMNTVIEEIPSPNGHFIAYVFIRDGGATTNESYQLTIFRNNRKLYNSGGNVFVSDYIFNIEWISDNELHVNNTSTAGIYKQKQEIFEINIKYKNMNDE